MGNTFNTAIPLSGSGPYTLGPHTMTSFEVFWYTIPSTTGTHYSWHASDGSRRVSVHSGNGSVAPTQIGVMQGAGGAGKHTSSVLYLRLEAGFIVGSVSISNTVTVASHGTASAPAGDTSGSPVSVDFADGSFAFDNTGSSSTSIGGFFRNRDMYYEFTCDTTGYYRLGITGMSYYDLSVEGPNIDPMTIYSYESGDSGGYGGVLDAGVTYTMILYQWFPDSDTSEDGFRSGTISWNLETELPPNAYGHNGTAPARIDITQRHVVEVGDMTPVQEDFNEVTLLYQLTAPITGILCIQMEGSIASGEYWYMNILNTVTRDSGYVDDDSASGTGGVRFGQVAVQAGELVYLDLAGSDFPDNFKWGIAGYDELTWSGWFDSANDYDPETTDPEVGVLWGTQPDAGPGGSWRVGRGPGVAWYSGGPFSNVGDALAYTAGQYATIPNADPGDTTTPPDGVASHGSGTRFGGGTYVLMGQAGGMDGAVHSEMWRDEQGVGAKAPETGTGWTQRDLRFKPAMARRTSNGIDTKYGISGNPFTSNLEPAYIQYGNDETAANDKHPWTLRMYLRTKLTWSNSLPLTMDAIVEILFMVIDDGGSGIEFDTAISDQAEVWPGGLGEQMATLTVPSGTGTDASPSSWALYPNQGELNDLEADILGYGSTPTTWTTPTLCVVAISYLPGIEDEFTNAHTWAAAGGPPSAYTGLYSSAWNMNGQTGAETVMGYWYDTEYRWGYLSEPNYDIIGGGWARLRVWMPSEEWLIIGNPDANFDNRFYVQDATTGDVWREFKTGDSVGGEERYLYVQSPDGPVNCARMIKQT